MTRASVNNRIVPVDANTATSDALRRPVFAALLALILALSLVLNGCGLPGNGSAEPETNTPAVLSLPDNEVVRQAGQDLFNRVVLQDTTTLNQLVADPTALGITPAKPTLGDYSLESYYEDCDFCQEILTRLEPLDPATLNESDAITVAVMRREIDQILREKDYFYYAEPLFPNMGVQANLPRTFLEYNFRDRQDIEDYLALLNDVPRYFDQIIAFEQVKKERKLLMNKNCFDDILKEIDTFLVEPVSENVLIKAFAAQLSSGRPPFSDLSAEQSANLELANSEAVHNAVYPAFRALREAVASLKLLADDNTNIGTYENGNKYYALQMQEMGFKQTPEEAAALLDLRIEQFVTTVVENNAIMPEEIKPSIPNLTSPFPAKATLEHLNTAMLRNFPEIQAFGYTVQETPKELPNALTLAYYKIPAVDKPGDNQIYYYPDNFSDDLTYLTTLAHEGFPGHMYQTNYFTQSNPQPIRRLLLSNAYMEGYAMYAETLALNYLGLSEREVRSQAAYLAFAYAVRVRADIGVNYQGWTKDRLFDYLDNYGFSGAVDDLYRGAQTQPLFYLNYGLGLVFFLDLREQTEQRLGADFNEKAYHDVLLKNGPLPLEFLEQQTAKWADSVHK